MARRNGVEVQNTSAWKRGVQEVLRGLERDLAADLARAGLFMQSYAKELCPVDTGRLRSSITYSGVLHDGRGIYIQIGTNVAYARFVEYGTKHMSAQPYMRPALLATAHRLGR